MLCFLPDDHHAASVAHCDLHLVINQYEISEALCAVWEVYLRHTILALHPSRCFEDRGELHVSFGMLMLFPG